MTKGNGMMKLQLFCLWRLDSPALGECVKDEPLDACACPARPSAARPQAPPTLAWPELGQALPPAEVPGASLGLVPFRLPTELSSPLGQRRKLRFRAAAGLPPRYHR